MSLKGNGKTLYPLELNKIYSQGQTLHNRNTREKNWFYLAFNGFVVTSLPFKTADEKTLITANNDNFWVVKQKGKFK